MAISFGTVFVLVNSGGLARPWPLVIRTAGLLVAALLVLGLIRTARQAPPVATAPASGFMDRRYWLVAALEAAALFSGLAVVNGVLHRPAVSVAWVAMVVGMPFSGLAHIWRMPRYHPDPPYRLSGRCPARRASEM